MARRGYCLNYPLKCHCVYWHALTFCLVLGSLHLHQQFKGQNQAHRTVCHVQKAKRADQLLGQTVARSHKIRSQLVGRTGPTKHGKFWKTGYEALYLKLKQSVNGQRREETGTNRSSRKGSLGSATSLPGTMLMWQPKRERGPPATGTHQSCGNSAGFISLSFSLYEECHDSPRKDLEEPALTEQSMVQWLPRSSSGDRRDNSQRRARQRPPSRPARTQGTSYRRLPKLQGLTMSHGGDWRGNSSSVSKKGKPLSRLSKLSDGMWTQWDTALPRFRNGGGDFARRFHRVASRSRERWRCLGYRVGSLVNFNLLLWDPMVALGIRKHCNSAVIALL